MKAYKLILSQQLKGDMVLGLSFRCKLNFSKKLLSHRQGITNSLLFLGKNEMNKRIDIDISNIIHQLSFRNSRTFSLPLVRDVASFLKRLASDSGFVLLLSSMATSDHKAKETHSNDASHLQ
mmetsp:Transcript_3094/g.4120  ORF Transcript_3094/g.4120 Transcript_3094/m.4120 type:complete len:122 (+) Transcript_3094:535-900(+)